jgi:hypothetical protein
MAFKHVELPKVEEYEIVLVITRPRACLKARYAALNGQVMRLIVRLGRSITECWICVYSRRRLKERFGLFDPASRATFGSRLIRGTRNCLKPRGSLWG